LVADSKTVSRRSAWERVSGQIKSHRKRGVRWAQKIFRYVYILNTLRNNYAFHYPYDQDIDGAFIVASGDDQFDDYWNLYLSESSINSFHFASDVVIVHGMMNATKATDLLAAQEKITRDASIVAKLLTEFILDFSAAFVAKHFSVGNTQSEILGREQASVKTAPSLLEFWLPFYFEL
jgi:hypothetical protein